MHMTSTVLKGEHEHHYHYGHDRHYQVTSTTTLSLYRIDEVEAFTILIMRVCMSLLL